MGELVMEALATLRPGRTYPIRLGLPKIPTSRDSANSSAKSRWMTIDASCHNWFPPLEARMADTEWKPLPAGLWTDTACDRRMRADERRTELAHRWRLVRQL